MISDTPGRGGEGESKKGKFLRTSFMDGPYGIFGEGSQISTNQNQENNAFSLELIG